MHEMFTTRPTVSLHDLVFKSLSSAIKVAIFGNPLLFYLETLRQVAKKDHSQGQIQSSNTVLARSFPVRTFCRLLTFLVHDSSSGSFFSAI